VGESLFPKDVYIGTALVRAYAKCGSLSCAKRAFEQIYDPDVVSWTTIMDAYVQHGLGNEALLCFNRMRDAGVDPDAVTYICTLKACGIIGCFQIGEEIEAELQKKGLMPKNSEIVEGEAGKRELPLENCNIIKGEVRKRGSFPEAVALGSTLVDMYAKCGRLEKAQQVFDGLLVRNNVSWNVMITGYVQHGLNGDALECFFKMQGEGVLPDARTYASVLKACGALRSLEIGECISVEIQKRGLLKKDVVLGTTLVDMYAKCGMMQKAREVLEQLPMRDVVAWNALVSGYVKQGFGSEALECFRQMRREGISQNVVSYIYSLKACEIVGSLGIGEGIDVELRTQGLLREDVELGTALIGMYVKCGSLEIAREVFEWVPKRDIVCWNVMIAGYVEFVHVNGISDLLRDMGAKCILPDLVTFLLLLTACSHTGLVKEGESLFQDMCGMYGSHSNCRALQLHDRSIRPCWKL
jgi:pentatricopeptide repeat protein